MIGGKFRENFEMRKGNNNITEFWVEMRETVKYRHIVSTYK